MNFNVHLGKNKVGEIKKQLGREPEVAGEQLEDAANLAVHFVHAIGPEEQSLYAGHRVRDADDEIGDCQLEYQEETAVVQRLCPPNRQHHQRIGDGRK